MKITIKIISIFILTLAIGSCKQNSKESTSIEPSKKAEIIINPEEEYNKTNSLINNNQTESVSDKNYTIWKKDGKIIKLNVFEGDGENFANKEDYYFFDDKVYAFQKTEINDPDAINYRALIFFKNSEIIKEDYWISENKTTKMALENELKTHGSTIKNEFIDDELTKKSKGLLMVSDFSKRLGFKEQITSKSNKKSFGEIRGLIISGSKDNMKKELGEPNDDLSAYNFFQKYKNIKIGGVYGIQSILNTEVIIYNNIDITNKPIAVIYNYDEGVTGVKYLSEVNNIEDLRP